MPLVWIGLIDLPKSRGWLPLLPLQCLRSCNAAGAARCRNAPEKKCINFFLSPIIFHQPIFAMYNNEPWKLPVAHTWGPWQSKQSYETSWLSVWDSAAKPDPDFGLTRSTLPDFRVQSGRVGTSGCKNGLDRVDLKKGPKLDTTQR